MRKGIHLTIGIFIRDSVYTEYLGTDIERTGDRITGCSCNGYGQWRYFV